jgi:hypothetical protein
MITSDAVEQTCTEVGNYSEAEMASEFEVFFQSEPDVCDFVVELTAESGPRVQELSLFLSYMIFKNVRAHGGADVPPVTHDMIETAFRDSERWIEELDRGRGSSAPEAILSSLEAETEPYLLQYIITEISRTAGEAPDMTDEQKGEVFFVVKTVMSTFIRRPFERQKTDTN